MNSKTIVLDGHLYWIFSKALGNLFSCIHWEAGAKGGLEGIKQPPPPSKYLNAFRFSEYLSGRKLEIYLFAHLSFLAFRATLRGHHYEVRRVGVKRDGRARMLEVKTK